VNTLQDRTHQPENAGDQVSNYAQILLKPEGLNISRLEQKTGFEFLPLPLLIGTHTTFNCGAACKAVPHQFLVVRRAE